MALEAPLPNIVYLSLPCLTLERFTNLFQRLFWFLLPQQILCRRYNKLLLSLPLSAKLVFDATREG